MFISGIGTSAPPARYLKADCWEAFRESAWFDRLGPRAQAIAKTVLFRDNGMHARHLVVDSLAEAFEIDPDTLNRRFVTHAPVLAAQAATRALEQSGLAASRIDAIVISSCTGYLCPGLSSYVVERLGLRSDVQTYDLVGQGCAAALPNMRLGRALLATGACRHVLSVCVEICSAAMYLDDDPGVLISACLFGDGAGAVVLSNKPGERGRRVEWVDDESLIRPEYRDALRFETRGGLLRNILTREVPGLAARHAHLVLETVLERRGLQQNDLSGWIMHAGGRDVLAAVQQTLALPEHALRHSSEVLGEYGNLSSAFVYFVLQTALGSGERGGYWWLCAFGAGFSCHGALLKVE